MRDLTRSFEDEISLTVYSQTSLTSVLVFASQKFGRNVAGHCLPQTSKRLSPRLLTSRKVFDIEEGGRVLVWYLGIRKDVGQLLMLDYDRRAKIFLANHNKKHAESGERTAVQHGDSLVFDQHLSTTNHRSLASLYEPDAKSWPILYKA